MNAAAGRVAWKAVSKHATAGTSGRTAVTAASAARDFGWWSGARSVRASRRRDDAGVDPHGSGEGRPAVDDPVAHDVHRAEAADGVLELRGIGDAAGRGKIGGAVDDVAGVEHAQLEAGWTRR